MTKKIIILFEDSKRTKFVTDMLAQKKIPYELWDLSSHNIDMSKIPLKDVVYYNRVSPSSSTRGNDGTPAYAKILLSYLENHGATVINPSNTLDIEMSKAMQTILLNNAGIKTPQTFVCVGKGDVINVIKQNFLNRKLVIKTNLGGSGDNVEIYNDGKSAILGMTSNKVKAVDGVFIVQEYVHSITHDERQQIIQCSEELSTTNNTAPVPEIETGPILGPPVTAQTMRMSQRTINRVPKIAINTVPPPVVVVSPTPPRASMTPRSGRFSGHQQRGIVRQNGQLRQVNAHTTSTNKLIPQSKSAAATSGPDYAYRLEIIGHKVIYVLRMNIALFNAPQRCPCEGGTSILEKFQVLMKPEREIPFSSHQIFNTFSEKAVQFTKTHKIGTAAFEFRVNSSGEPTVYDLNINTNYNPSAEIFARKHYRDIEVPSGLEKLTEYLASHLAM